MASWVTHLMIADKVMEACAALDRRSFCVGNIAPDCNVENADWTSFTPPKSVTHWMQGERKTVTDCDGFYQEYLCKRKKEILSQEHLSFLLGYYAHLITDALFQRFIREEQRVKDAWTRIKNHETLKARAVGYPEDWDSVKRIISNQERGKEIELFEAEYLREHKDSGYLTEILTLTEFPDYIDYLPTGCIVRKIGVMGTLPRLPESPFEPIGISREEYQSFVENAVCVITERFREIEEECFGGNDA